MEEVPGCMDLRGHLTHCFRKQVTNSDSMGEANQTTSTAIAMKVSRSCIIGSMKGIEEFE
jgi:hypothetical protein